MAYATVRGNAPIRGDYDRRRTERIRHAISGPRKCPDQRGLRLQQSGCVTSPPIPSEEMPRSEGITTYRIPSPSSLADSPRKCPDQRGLRPDDLPDRPDGSVSPRKCPDQRGLRPFRESVYLPHAEASEEMPRSEGITTHQSD